MSVGERTSLAVVAALGILASVLVVVAGWFVTQWQARRGVRRNLRIQYLLESYRRLEGASDRQVMTDDYRRDIEQAIADVMLLGTPSQVELAHEFARAMVNQESAGVEPLLQDLRMTLRRELDLEPVPPSRLWLRLNVEPTSLPDRPPRTRRS